MPVYDNSTSLTEQATRPVGAGRYGRDNVFRSMLDVQFTAAMGPAGGGRNPVTGRYLRHFNLLSIVDVADNVLTSIFETILTWYMKDGKFPKDVQDLSRPMITSTLQVYSSAMQSLLPTPSKSHYVFNLRDFARVVQGIMLTVSKTLPTGGGNGKKFMLTLWVHEILRVFYDRLTDVQDQTWMLALLKKLLPANFETDFNQLLVHLTPDHPEGDPPPDLDVSHMRRLFFGNYMDPEKGGEDQPAREYARVSSYPNSFVIRRD